MTNDLALIKAKAEISAIIPTDLSQIERVASLVANSGLAPKGLQRPEQIAIAMMQGMEVGLKPMQSLKSIAVINGRPCIWGDGAMSLVRASGLCKRLEERIEGQGDDLTAVCITERTDAEGLIKRTFSVSQAKQANLWGKSGPWTQYPERMLAMRARGFAIRDAFADVLSGMQIAEEVRDCPEEHQEPEQQPVTLDELKQEPETPEEESQDIDDAEIVTVQPLDRTEVMALLIEFDEAQDEDELTDLLAENRARIDAMENGSHKNTLRQKYKNKLIELKGE
jgi:hypothetical protein